MSSLVHSCEAASTNLFLFPETASHLLGVSRPPRSLCGRICRSHDFRLDAAKAARSPLFHSGLNERSSCLNEDSTPSGGHGDGARSSILMHKNRTASDTGRIEGSDRMQSGWDVFVEARARDCDLSLTPQRGIFGRRINKQARKAQ